MLDFMYHGIAEMNSRGATALTVIIVSLMIFLFNIYAHAATSVTLDQIKKDGYLCEELDKEQLKCSKIYYCLLSNGLCFPKPIS